MPFPKEPVRAPGQIGRVTVTLTDIPTPASSPLLPAGQSAAFELDILDPSGAFIRTVSGDLGPHITAAQRNSLVTFLNNLRAQAQTQIVG